MSQSRHGNDLIAAEFLAATHLNFPDGKIRTLEHKPARRRTSGHQLPTPSVERDGQNDERRKNTNPGNPPTPSAIVSFAVIPAINSELHIALLPWSSPITEPSNFRL
jgi:hypothetical protein